MKYLIAYDLTNGDHDKLNDAMIGKFDCISVVETTWLVCDRDRSTKSILERFINILDNEGQRIVDDKDEVIVVKVKDIKTTPENLIENAKRMQRIRLRATQRLKAATGKDPTLVK